MIEQKLVTLTGPSESLYMDQIRANQSFQRLDDIEAGLLALQGIAEFFPELTWNDFRPEFWPLTKAIINQEAKGFKMHGCSDCSSCSMSGKCSIWAPQNCVINLASDVKDAAVDLANWTGDKAGDAIRLLTDEEVIDGAARIGTAYATSGGSEGLKALTDQFGPELGGVLESLIGGLGGKAKKDVEGSGWGADLISGVPNEYLAMGGAGLFVVILLMVAMR